MSSPGRMRLIKSNERENMRSLTQYRWIFDEKNFHYSPQIRVCQCFKWVFETCSKCSVVLCCQKFWFFQFIQLSLFWHCVTRHEEIVAKNKIVSSNLHASSTRMRAQTIPCNSSIALVLMFDDIKSQLQTQSERERVVKSRYKVSLTTSHPNVLKEYFIISQSSASSLLAVFLWTSSHHRRVSRVVFMMWIAVDFSI